MAQVDRLFRGLTTMTAHARYYSLHALVATEVETQNLDSQQAIALLRRVEVVMAGVSLAHQYSHPGMPAPHGAGPIGVHLAASGIDVAGLADTYSPRSLGFWSQYLGSESILGLVDAYGGRPVPGVGLERLAVRDALGDLLPLAAKDHVDLTDLRAHTHLCMCQGAEASDGDLLRRRFMPSVVRADFSEDRRTQSLRMLFRLLDVAGGVASPEVDLSQMLMFDQAVVADETVSGAPAYWAWVGVALRALSVAGWRGLWAWLVENIEGFMSIDSVGGLLADELPAMTVRQWCASLPDTHIENSDGTFTLLPAERHSDLRGLAAPVRHLAVLAIGARRVGHLDRRTAAYFEGSDEVFQQLTPSWLFARLEEFADRPLRDFALDLTRTMVDRSQRIALEKSRFDTNSGRFVIPTRVYLRDDSIFRDSSEGRGGISLRFDTAMTLMSGLGYVTYTGDRRWVLTDRGRAA